MNGGTALSIAGDDFAVLAADTRMSAGFNILSRNQTKIVRLTEKCLLASCGCKTDADTLHKMLRARLTMYHHQHGKEASTPAIAQMLSNILYYKRFFPYYTFNLLSGVDEHGRGCVYTYDAIGSYERVYSSAQGSGQSLMMPVLDNQVYGKNMQTGKPTLSQGEVVDLIKDVFSSATERDIYTGDGLEIMVVDKHGINVLETLELRRD